MKRKDLQLLIQKKEPFYLMWIAATGPLRIVDKFLPDIDWMYFRMFQKLIDSWEYVSWSLPSVVLYPYDISPEQYEPIDMDVFLEEHFAELL